MRIVVNDIAASEGGALTVLEELIDDVKLHGNDHEWIFLLGDKNINIYNNKIKFLYFEKIKKSWIKRLYFEIFNGKKIINNLNPDIYISLQNTATLGVKAKQYVYLHQAIPFQKEKNFSFIKPKERKLAVYQYLFKILYSFLYTKSKCTLIVQSKWLEKILKIKYSNDTIVVQPSIPSINISNGKKIDKSKIIFFYPAGNFIYKNHDVLFNAFSKVKNEEIYLYVTVDKKDFPLITDQRIIFLGKISRDNVLNIMKKTILVFPSYIETYGLPLLEAKILNRPIIASNTCFSREILDDYELKKYFDFNSEDDLKLKLEEMIYEKKDNIISNRYDKNNSTTIVKAILNELN